jgi:hypothetical protein
MTKSVEEVKLTKAAKAKAARALQAEERTNAMIALAKKRGKLWDDDGNVGSKTRLADSPSAAGTGEGRVFRRLVSERLL